MEVTLRHGRVHADDRVGGDEVPAVVGRAHRYARSRRERGLVTGGGSTDDLYLGTGEGGRFTLVVFYRGLHCPVCRRQLKELDERLADLRAVGVGRVVAVCMESEERSKQAVAR